MGTANQMGYTEMHIGGIEAGSMVTSSSPSFRGSLQQLIFNGQKLFELANTGQLAIKYNVSIVRTIFEFPNCSVEKKEILKVPSINDDINQTLQRGKGFEFFKSSYSFPSSHCKYSGRKGPQSLNGCKKIPIKIEENIGSKKT